MCVGHWVQWDLHKTGIYFIEKGECGTNWLESMQKRSAHGTDRCKSDNFSFTHLNLQIPMWRLHNIDWSEGHNFRSFHTESSLSVSKENHNQRQQVFYMSKPEMCISFILVQENGEKSHILIAVLKGTRMRAWCTDMKKILISCNCISTFSSWTKN